MIKSDILNDLDLSRSFEQNELLIQERFYNINFPIGIYSVFPKEDVREMYVLIQELMK